MNRIFVILAALICAISGAASAGPAKDMVEVTVLPGWRNADGTHFAAVQIKLADGWKTYWRAPGDAGIPPQFKWRKSSNLGKVDINWPTPKLLAQNGMTAIGYDHSVVLPLLITPRNAGADVKLAAKVELGVCRDVCVPVNLKIAGVLPADVQTRDTRIVAALANRPFTAQEGRVSKVSCHLSPVEGGLKLRAEITVPKGSGTEAAVIETSDPEIWVAGAETTRQGGQLVAQTQLFHVEGRAFALDRSQLRITVLSRGLAVDVQGCSAS